MNDPRSDLEQIFRAGLERADPYQMIVEHLHLDRDLLTIQFEKEDQRYNLAQFTQIFVFGAGKAGARMAQAIEHVLAGRITGGLVTVKYGYGLPLEKIRLAEAAHPVPDENSLRSAREIAQMSASFDEHTLVINLISGGGSALFDGLIEYEDNGRMVALTLADLQATTQALLASGADITEINCLRKHLSTVKGGRYVSLLYPATSINLILSDVIGDRLDAIASGLTVPDRTTFQEAWAIVEKYHLAEKLPAAVRRALQLGVDGQIEETPKPGDPIFERTHNVLIGTLYHSLLAAAEQARALGYATILLSSQWMGEARALSVLLAGMARDVYHHEMLAPRPACLIGGGETTVTLRGSGKGGRNQEIALAFVEELSFDLASAPHIFLLSASTDGSDGPTDAAGAFASWDIAQRARRQQLDVRRHLDDNDSYHFFEALDALFKTGPTGTNVCDLQIVLVTEKD